MRKPHKHSNLIKLWADGAEIQILNSEGDWCSFAGEIAWNLPTEYRIKPEPKPDVLLAYFVNPSNPLEEDGPSIEWTGTWRKCNLKLTFDGVTGQLKAAEVLK